jgi:hypothetical protein
MVFMLAPFFDLGVDFKVFIVNITMLVIVMVAKDGNFNPAKKTLLVTTLFDLRVDFGVFDQKM